MTASPALAVNDLTAGYEPGVAIVRQVSVAVSAHEIVALLGPNGAGKSTLIKAIAGLVPLQSGTIRLGDLDITGQPAHRMARSGLAFVPQTENIFTRMSVDDNLHLAAGILAAAARASRIAEMYALFPDLARQRRLAAGRLSGGQRQMLAIARALMVKPKVLMLDEPSAGLAPKLVDLVFAKLDEIRQSNVAVVLVEQNARAALAVADRGYILVEGQNRHEGPADSLWNDPALARLYFGAAATAPSQP